MSRLWKEQVLEQVIAFCNARGRRTFTLQEFLVERLKVLQVQNPANRHVAAKVRQQFQFLRDDKMLTFVDNNGSYTLRGIKMLQHEMEAMNELAGWSQSELWQSDGSPAFFDDQNLPLVPAALPETREHLVETYVRNKGWAKDAKEAFGTDCMIDNCKNRFTKPDGLPYIEVHHIIPLCENGEDGVWNLSVLCAHHHRMAHFANDQCKEAIRELLLEEVQQRL